MRMTAPRFRASMEALLAAGTGSLLLPLYTAATITVGALALVLFREMPRSMMLLITSLIGALLVPLISRRASGQTRAA